ncbi:MAG: hypothetical protein GEV08_13215 [Acidimicrobiia bacterium]|nr:hypothetical protein [Acidimicrobiia bacterium]
MQELVDFYEGYIAAFNARDAVAFGACFHPPVTMMRPARHDGRADEQAFTVVEDPGSFALQMPAHWSRSTIDSLVALGEAAPFAVSLGLPAPRARRLGIIADVSRWDHDGQLYEQVQALYLLAHRGGRLGIKFMADLGFTRRPREPRPS